MKELTKAEEQVMQYIWKLNKAFMKDIVEQFPEPKPAYTTISTVINVLVKKDFVGFNRFGKIKEYYPLISKSKYFKSQLKTSITNYFNGSNVSFASFFAQNKDLDLNELKEIRSIIDQQINQLKSDGNK